MHELSIAQSLAEQIEDVVAREGATRATLVLLEVGAMSGVDPEALRLAFSVAMEGTVADGAQLDIVQTPSRIHCRDCGKTENGEDMFPLCPACASTSVDVVGGRDLLLKSLELAT